MAAHSIWQLRGLRPRTPGYFFDAEKVTKKAHKGGTLSMGSLPYGSHPHDDTKGGARRHKLRIPHPDASVRLRSLRCASFFLGKRSAGLPRSGPCGAVIYAGLPAGQPSTCPVVLRVLPGMRYTRIYQCPSLLFRRLGHLWFLHIECIAAKSV